MMVEATWREGEEEKRPGGMEDGTCGVKGPGGIEEGTWRDGGRELEGWRKDLEG